jgi:hypothetical protein
MKISGSRAIVVVCSAKENRREHCGSRCTAIGRLGVVQQAMISHRFVLANCNLNFLLCDSMSALAVPSCVDMSEHSARDWPSCRVAVAICSSAPS